MQVALSEQERIVEASVRRAFGELGAKLPAEAPPAVSRAAIETTLAELGLLEPSGRDAGDDPLASLGVAQIVATEAGRASLAYPILERLVVAVVAGRSAALRRLLHGFEMAHVGIAGASASPERPLRLAGGRLHGTSSLVTFPDDARCLLATALDTTAGGVRNALVVIDPQHPQITLCFRTSVEPNYPVADLLADGVPLDADQPIMTLDDGSNAARTFELVATLLTAAEIVGAASAALELTTTHLNTRTQFGRPLGAQQVLRHLMADNFVRVEAMSAALTYATLAMCARAGDAEAGIRSVKHYASTAGKTLAEDMLQMHGAIGFTAEYGLARLLRRILRLCAMHGTPREQETRLYAMIADDGAIG